MKIVFQNAIWILIFGAYNYLCIANENDNDVIKLGALFDEENSQSKVALDTIIYKSNQNDERVVLEKQTVSTTDSFKSGKQLCNMVEDGDGIAGIIGPSSSMSSSIIQSICMNLEIPNIQISWQPSANPALEGTVINFFPKPQLFSQGLAAIVKNLQWRSFVILYENDDGLIRLQDVLKLQSYDTSSKLNSIVVKKLTPGPDHRPLLKDIRNSTENHIILDCKTDKILEILKQAVEVKLMEPYYNYFITSLDAHTLDFKTLNSSSNITTVRIFDPQGDKFNRALSDWRQFSQRDFDAYSIETETVLMHDATMLLLDHLKPPLKTRPLSCQNEMDKWSMGFQITSSITNKKENGLTGPIAFNDFGQRINFAIDVIDGNRENVIARWTADQPNELSFIRSENDSYNALLRNMKKEVLIISSRLGPPYLMERVPEEGEVLVGNSRYEGYSIDLIKEIADDLKFRFEFRLTEDGKYGNWDPDKKAWNGLIKDLLEHKADLAICDLTITHQRREVVDFSMPFMRLGVSILYKKAEEKEINMFAFLDPFSIEVWIYTATLYLTVSVILYFVYRMAPGDWENPHPCDANPPELENIWDLKNCFWLTLGSIMQQGCDILPKGISSRMASSMWWFFSLIMTSSYTANLAAFLTMERMEPTIDSAEALAKQTKIKYGTVNGGSTQAFFRDSNYSTYQRMWTMMEQSKPGVFEKSNADGVKRVQNTRQRMYAFLMESSQIEYEVETKCDLKQVGNWLDSKGYGIAMPVEYPYRSAINGAILKLQENGRLGELKDRWWKKMRSEPSCPKSGSEEKSAELALANVGGVFLVLGIGVAVAFMIAILEFLWNVRNISVEEHISYWEAFKIEFIFALNVWITKKSTKPNISESSSSHSGEDAKSIAHSILQGAGSFLHLNLAGKGRHSPSTKEALT